MGGPGVQGGTMGIGYLGPPPSVDQSQSLVLVGQQSGFTVIPQATPLTRLNYFDGKFLRAQDLYLEQTYIRRLVAQSNQAGGAGVVDGLSASLVNDQILVTPGLAIDGAGQVLLLPISVQMGVQELIAASQQTSAGQLAASVTGGSAQFTDCVVQTSSQPSAAPGSEHYYLLTAGWAEALCGEENVFGQLCEDACASTSDHSFRVEGIVFRLRPLLLARPPGTKSTQINYSASVHLRSLLASEVFAEEPGVFPDLISRSGLATDTWCAGALLSAPSEVALAVLARTGNTTLFLDAWTARRERIETPPRRYWAWRMAMRPWDVYLAQILQFQCQLHDLILGPTQAGGPTDPCAPASVAIDHASRVLVNLHDSYAAILQQLPANVAGDLQAIRDQLQGVLQGSPITAVERILINGGILELPSAGYLPIDNSAQSLTVNDQVVRLLGEGLDLRFCVVRPDYVPHALEEAQHMQRISLLAGLDDPKTKPRVDVLVPDGEILNVAAVSGGRGYEGELDLLPDRAGKASTVLTGAARSDRAGSDGYSFTYAGAGGSATSVVTRVAGVMNNLATMDTAAVAGMARAPIVDFLATQAHPSFDLAFNTLGVAADAHLAALRAAPGLGAAVAPAPGITFQPQPSTAAGSDLPVLWFTLNSDRDLLKLNVGDASQVTLRYAMVAGISGAVAQKGQLSVAARVSNIATGAEGRAITLNLSGLASHTDTTTSTVKTVEVNLVVVLNDFTGRPSGPTVELDFAFQPPGSPAKISFAVTLSWQTGPPLTLKVGVAMTPATGAAATALGSAQFIENRDVLLPQNPKHILSLSALNVIAAHLKDPAFAENESLGLFPPPPVNAGHQIVRALRDWVLFARRRDIDCGEAEAPLVTPGRQYRIYHRAAGTPAEVAAVMKVIRDAVQSGDSSQIPGLNLVGLRDLAAFAGGLPNLVGRPDLILQDLKGANAGNRLEYAALLPRDATDARILGNARLDSLEQALAAVCPADLVHLTTEVLPKLPAALDVAGTDGAIVLITMNAPTICTEIYRAPSNVWAAARNQLLTGDPSPLSSSDFSLLTNVTFNQDSTSMTDSPSQLKNAWAARNPVLAAMVVYNVGDQTIGDASTWQQRVTQMLSFLQTQGVQQADFVAVKGLPTTAKCPVITILVEQVVLLTCHQVFELTNNAALQSEVIKLLTAGDFTNPLIPRATRVLGKTGIVHFQEGSTTPDSVEAQAITDAWWNKSSSPPTTEAFQLFYNANDASVEPAILADRVAAIASWIGRIPTAGLPAPIKNPISAKLPGGCPVWTFIVPSLPGQAPLTSPTIFTAVPDPGIVMSPPAPVGVVVGVVTPPAPGDPALGTVATPGPAATPATAVGGVAPVSTPPAGVGAGTEPPVGVVASTAPPTVSPATVGVVVPADTPPPAATPPAVMPPIAVTPPIAATPPIAVTPPTEVVPPTMVAPPASVVPPTAVTPPPAITPPTAVMPPIEVVPPTAVAPPTSVVPPTADTPPPAITPPIAVTPPTEVVPPTAVAPPTSVVPPTAVTPPIAVTPPTEVVPPTVVAPPTSVVPPTAVTPPIAVTPPTEVVPPTVVAPPTSVVPPTAVTPPPAITPPIAITPPTEVVPPTVVAPPTSVVPPTAVTPPPAITPPIAITPPTEVVPPTAVAPPTSVMPPTAVTPPPAITPPVAVTPPIAVTPPTEAVPPTVVAPPPAATPAPTITPPTAVVPPTPVTPPTAVTAPPAVKAPPVVTPPQAITPPPVSKRPAAAQPPAVAKSPAAGATPVAGQVGTIAHSVYAVSARSLLWKNMLQSNLVKGTATDVTLQELSAKGIITLLGVVTFAAGTAAAKAGPGMKKLSDVKGATAAVSQPAQFFFLEATPPELVELMQQQVQAIQTLVGSPKAAGQQAAPALASPPGGSEILTFIQWS